MCPRAIDVSDLRLELSFAMMRQGPMIVAEERVAVNLHGDEPSGELSATRGGCPSRAARWRAPSNEEQFDCESFFKRILNGPRAVRREITVPIE